MNRAEMTLQNHCRLSIETLHPRFTVVDPTGFSIILTVNSGYE